MLETPFWCEIDNVTSDIMELPSFECVAVRWGYTIRRGDAEARGIDEKPLSDKHHWFNVEKPTVSGSSNLKTQHQVYVKTMKETSVTFCFLKSKAKEKASFSKIIGEWWLLCGEFRSLLSKLMFTHSASYWSHSHGIVET